MEPKTSSLDDMEGRAEADSFEGSSSESDQDDNKYENENEPCSTPPGSTITDQKMMMIKKIAIPNPASAAANSKAANPKRVRAEKGCVVHVSSKKKKSSPPTPTLPVVDVKKESAANSKPPLSAGRIWSEEDEIVILEGYRSFMEEKGRYNAKAKVLCNAKEFYIYIKDRLSYAGYWTQLRDKVKHLKDKYRTQFVKSKNGAIELKTPHDIMVYNLSVKAWHDEFAKQEGEKDKFAKKKVEKDNFEDDEPLQGEDQAEDGAGADKLNEKKVQAASVAVQEGDDDDDDYVDDRVIPHGLRDYFQSELFDGRWVDDDQLRSLETKWKKLQVSRANYKSAKSQFKAMLYQLAVQGYNMNKM